MDTFRRTIARAAYAFAMFVLFAVFVRLAPGEPGFHKFAICALLVWACFRLVRHLRAKRAEAEGA